MTLFAALKILVIFFVSHCDEIKIVGDLNVSQVSMKKEPFPREHMAFERISATHPPQNFVYYNILRRKKKKVISL